LRDAHSTPHRDMHNGGDTIYHRRILTQPARDSSDAHMPLNTGTSSSSRTGERSHSAGAADCGATGGWGEGGKTHIAAHQRTKALPNAHICAPTRKQSSASQTRRGSHGRHKSHPNRSSRSSLSSVVALVSSISLRTSLVTRVSSKLLSVCGVSIRACSSTVVHG
jgi:hypothetical protein